jgi:hypothetical protein
MVNGGGSQYIPDWDFEITVSGTHDDRALFSANIVSKSTTDPTDNIIKAEAVGVNTTGRAATATLRIYLTGEPGTYTDIQLVQQPLAWSVPSVVAAIPAAGGTTAELGITIPATGLHYTVEIVNLTPSALSSHFAYLIDPDEGGGTRYSKLKARDVSQKFIVGFPKLIWPNINLQPQATVRVTLVESGEVKTFTVSQSAIVQRELNMLNVGTSWGRISSTSSNSTWSASFNSSYNADFVNSLESVNNFGPNGTVKTRPRRGTTGLSSIGNSASNWNSVWPSVQNDVTFINFSRPSDTNTTANAGIWDWMEEGRGDKGVAFINTEGGTSEARNDFSSSWIPGQLGLTGEGSYNHTYGLNSNFLDNKVMRYLLNGPFGTVPTNQTFTTSGITSRINTVSVTDMPHAVPVLTTQTYCALMIDPSRNVLVKVDSEMTTGSSNSPVFWRNVLAFAVNNAQYGSYFSDYFWNSARVLMTEPQAQQ